MPPTTRLITPVLTVFTALLATLPAPASAADASIPSAAIARLERQPPDSPQRVELLKVQIALDRANFRPGKLDGLGGEFTQAAADRFNRANDLPPGALIDTTSVAEPLISYTLTEDDLKWIGRLASTPAAQEKLSRMPYGDPWELVAEKFHTDLNYLRELNPEVTNPVAGTTFRVPNVIPFGMPDVIALNDERTAKAKAAKATPSPSPTPSTTLESLALAAQETAPMQDPASTAALTATAIPTPSPTPLVSPTPAATPPYTPTVSLVLLREPRIIEVYEDDKLVANYPCTPGSSRVPVPVGTWKITSNVLMPYFRYDKSVLKDGTRSDNAFNIPPGPNNYVGIVWMGINRKSVGIHGTQHPDQIGRNQSSGCIRLANWDAFDLTQRVKIGTPVVVR